jgi:hypothetical protein
MDARFINWYCILTNHVRGHIYRGQRILIDSIITLVNAFKEAGCNPPRKLEVDSQTFDKLLAEATSKKAIVDRKFSIANIITIIEG